MFSLCFATAMDRVIRHCDAMVVFTLSGWMVDGGSRALTFFLTILRWVIGDSKSSRCSVLSLLPQGVAIIIVSSISSVRSVACGLGRVRVWALASNPLEQFQFGLTKSDDGFKVSGHHII